MDFEEMLGLKELGLKYQYELAGFDGENFTYTVYVEGDVKEKAEKLESIIIDYAEKYEEEDDYIGYIDVSVSGIEGQNTINVYQDLGNADTEDQDLPIHAVLKAINQIDGVIKVVINEDSSFDF